MCFNVLRKDFKANTMTGIPTTSTTLLRDIASDSKHARWGEFVARYRPMMEAFLREKFPSVDVDDIIQETLVSVWDTLPSYRYSPDEKGHFHNYLTGIVRNKALRQLGRDQRQTKIVDEIKQSRDDVPPGIVAADEQSWRETIVEIALRQLMNDESILSRNRQVFLRVAVNGDKPDNVAAAFGIKRNAVHLIKMRLMQRLRKIVAALEEAGGI